MIAITLLAGLAAASAAVLFADPALPAEVTYLVPAGFAFAAWLVACRRAEIARLRIAVQESITIDALTAALNRRGLEEAGRRELLAASRSGAPTALVLCRVEHYERLEESFGTAAADAALITASDRLRVACRPRDRIGRVETTVFAVLLPETPRDAAVAVAERLCTDLRKAGVALSFGVATSPEDGLSVEELLGRAAEPAAPEVEVASPSWRPEDLTGAYASSDAD